MNQARADQKSNAAKEVSRAGSDESRTAPVAAAGAPSILQLQRAAGNAATQRFLAGSGRTKENPRVARPSVRQSVQRFDSDEHLKIGDGAAEPGAAKPQTVQLAADYSLTYGEMIAMAGDYFESIAQMRSMAAVAGTGSNTRGELEFVRWSEVRKMKNGGPDGKKWDATAEASATRRYYDLKGRNASHFPNPAKGDESRPASDKAEDGEKTRERLQWDGLVPGMVEITGDANAGTAYRKGHVQALVEAYFAGMEGKPIDFAMAAEAFSAHFLTDSFSGGHLRTKRTDIGTHWDTKLPMFNYNLKGYIAQKLAQELSAGKVYSADLAYHGPPWDEGTLQIVTKLIDSKGFISFGEVVSGAIHDFDSKRGVRVTVEGKDARMFGDAALGQGDEEQAAVQAVNASANEVSYAWAMGQKKADPLVVRNSVFKDKMFAAERLLPTVKPDSEVDPADKAVKWDYDSAAALLGDAKFKEGFGIFAGNKASEFAAVKAALPDKAQQDAIQKAIIDPLSAGGAAMKLLNDVINWTPDTGGGIGGHNQDDNAMDYYKDAKKAGALATLTVEQKKRIVGHLLDGWTIGDEEDAILELLAAVPSHAREIIVFHGWGRLQSSIDNLWGNRFEKAYPKKSYER